MSCGLVNFVLMRSPFRRWAWVEEASDGLEPVPPGLFEPLRRAQDSALVVGYVLRPEDVGQPSELLVVEEPSDVDRMLERELADDLAGAPDQNVPPGRHLDEVDLLQGRDVLSGDEIGERSPFAGEQAAVLVE